jgi:hypothetical protein
MPSQFFADVVSAICTEVKNEGYESALAVIREFVEGLNAINNKQVQFNLDQGEILPNGREYVVSYERTGLIWFKFLVRLVRTWKR